MSTHRIVGVDPGLVHTGVVVLRINEPSKDLHVEHYVITGEDHAVQVYTLLVALRTYKDASIFIEAYRERGQSFDTNKEMRELMAEFRREMPKAKVIDNTGVKKVVRKPLLKVLGLDRFPTTHHQDLQSAARILVYGAVKDEELNAVIYQVLSDHVDGHPWTIHR